VREFEFEVRGRTPMLNETMRDHWSKRKKQGEAWAWMIRKEIGSRVNDEPMQKCILIITRYAYDNASKTKKLDWDGLLGGAKLFIDILTATHSQGLGLIQDDSTECIIAMPTIIPVIIEKDEFERTQVRIFEVE